MVPLSKYSGAGNDFLVLDGRGRDVAEFRSSEKIKSLCSRSEGIFGGADGLMILSEGKDGADFTMEYYNSDGSSGMMCGNGGRCIAAFAADLGIAPSSEGGYRFLAPDAVHRAKILSSDGARRTVRLGMRDVAVCEKHPDGWFLDTGTRHFVKFVQDVEAVDVARAGAEIRWREEFLPLGANADFIAPVGPGRLRIRTFEKGVEAETQACGTGIVAGAVAAWASFGAVSSGERMRFEVRARRDTLLVEFTPGEGGIVARDIALTGPAEKIC